MEINLIFSQTFVLIYLLDCPFRMKKCNYDQSISEQLPIRLSYEGHNNYNALFPKDHQFHKSRPGVQEMVVLSSTFLRKLILPRRHPRFDKHCRVQHEIKKEVGSVFNLLRAGVESGSESKIR